MNEFSIIILTPGECNHKQLKNFYDIVILGGQIPSQFIKNGISRADFLAFYEREKEVAGIASIKNPEKSYKVGVFKKANVEHLADKYDLEIGYAVTIEKFRGQGISPVLIQSLIDHSNSASFYATTKVDAMRNIFLKMGFEQQGNNYSNKNKEVLSLFTFDKSK